MIHIIMHSLDHILVLHHVQDGGFLEVVNWYSLLASDHVLQEYSLIS